MDNPYHMKDPIMKCPYCQSKLTVRHGKRKLKRATTQIYKCNSCKRFFNDKALKHKSYDAKTILRAISFYNLGYTFQRANKQMSKHFHKNIPLSTLQSWLKEYSNTCAFSRLRKHALKLSSPGSMIFTQSLQHKQIYKYQLHKAKLELVKAELPEQKFQLLKAYLEKIPTEKFPHHIFQPKQEELEELTRSSRIKFETLDFVKAEKQNLSNTLASLGLQLANNNKQRHEAIQNFMLINDSTTIACEAPVYLTADDIKYFNARTPIKLDFLEGCQTPVTGHIDILQIRNGLLHILDYKPEAKNQNPIEQLTIYALALASRTKLAVKDFKCAWFDENNYFEFFPLHAVYKLKKNEVLSKNGIKTIKIVGPEEV